MRQKLLLYIQTHPRRALLLLLLAILVITLIPPATHQATTGAVVIRTNSASNNVQIRSVNDTRPILQSSGNLKGRLAPGTYVVGVSNKAGSKNRVFQIYARHTATYTINLEGSISTQSVLPFGALNIIADGSVMYYVDVRDNQLYKLDAGGIPVAISQNITFNNIKWLNTGYGVGKSQDNNLYVIRNGSVSPFNMPFAAKNTLTYDLRPDGRLVISDGKTVYLQAVSGAFTKIYQADGNHTIGAIAASNTSTFVRFSLDNDSSSAHDTGQSIIINQQGQVLARNNGLSIYTYAWSPDGKFLAVTGNVSALILDNHLRQVKRIGNNDVVGAIWLNNNELAYGTGSNLFRYNIQTNDSTRLSATDTGNSIAGIYPTSDGSQIYLAETSGSTNPGNYKTLRVGLTNTKGVPGYNYTVGIFFPSHTDQCNFTYTNFLRPTIIVNSWVNTDACRAAAQAELAADNLTVSAFNIAFAAPPDE